MKKILFLLSSHIAFALAGFAIGIYTLPILTASAPPSESEMQTAVIEAEFKGDFKRDLAGSDFLHWGEGTVSIGKRFISLKGKVAPGPDYKLYLSPSFVESEEQFIKIKDKAVRVGDIKTFNNFIIPVAANIDPKKYNTVVVWCESFGEFISAAQYQ